VREPHKPESIERAKYGWYGNTDRGFVSGKWDGWDDSSQFNHPNGRNIRSVWEFPTQPFPAAHFAVFPEKLPELCIKAASQEGDIVLDPFMGSGTTLEVAAYLGRHAVGYELSRYYCDMAVKRNQQGVLEALLTDKKGVLSE